jgi:hypothetical protein
MTKSLKTVLSVLALAPFLVGCIDNEFKSDEALYDPYSGERIDIVTTSYTCYEVGESGKRSEKGDVWWVDDGEREGGFFYKIYSDKNDSDDEKAAFALHGIGNSSTYIATLKRLYSTDDAQDIYIVKVLGDTISFHYFKDDNPLMQELAKKHSVIYDDAADSQIRLTGPADGQRNFLLGLSQNLSDSIVEAECVSNHTAAMPY